MDPHYERAVPVRAEWRFNPGEPLRDAFRRTAADEIGAVRTALESEKANRDKGVHEARRSFKRLRALLRLASPGMERSFAKENRRLRDAGRLLAPARDAAVLVSSFDGFVESHGHDLDPSHLATFRARLARKTDAPAAENAALEKHVAKVLGLLERSERNLARLDWPGDPENLDRGLRKANARLTAAFRAARASGEAEHLHDWRKRLKDQSAHMELFRAVLPGSLKPARKSAKEIAQILGDEHDLCLLVSKLRAGRCPTKTRDTRDALVERIEARRAKMRQKAFRLGEAHGSGETDGFARDLCAAWEAGQPQAA